MEKHQEPSSRKLRLGLQFGSKGLTVVIAKSLEADSRQLSAKGRFWEAVIQVRLRRQTSCDELSPQALCHKGSRSCHRANNKRLLRSRALSIRSSQNFESAPEALDREKPHQLHSLGQHLKSDYHPLPRNHASLQGWPTRPGCVFSHPGHPCQYWRKRRYGLTPPRWSQSFRHTTGKQKCGRFRASSYSQEYHPQSLRHRRRAAHCKSDLGD